MVHLEVALEFSGTKQTCAVFHGELATAFSKVQCIFGTRDWEWLDFATHSDRYLSPNLSNDLTGYLLVFTHYLDNWIFAASWIYLVLPSPAATVPQKAWKDALLVTSSSFAATRATSRAKFGVTWSQHWTCWRNSKASRMAKISRHTSLTPLKAFKRMQDKYLALRSWREHVNKTRECYVQDLTTSYK